MSHPDPFELSPSYVQSARRDRERRRRALDTQRYEYHAGQAERLKKTMSQLVEHHERAAEKLLEGMSV
jgi:hypothetical protein